MKRLMRALLAAIGGGGASARRRRRPVTRAAGSDGRPAGDSATPMLPEPVDKVDPRMPEQAEGQAATVEQALLDGLEATIGAKFQAQLITLARLIGETAPAQAAPPAVRPAAPGSGSKTNCHSGTQEGAARGARVRCRS